MSASSCCRCRRSWTTWLLARVHERSSSRAPLIAGVALNLLSLGTFKYFNFVFELIGAVVGITLPPANIILPIGISFFSFQLISYLVDRMRGQAPIYQFRPFALFVLLYPHLIAGPIVRHNELVPQFSFDPRRENMWQRIGIGLVIFTVGFAKKVLLADNLGAVVDPLFADARLHALNLGEAWTAVLGFSFQLFLDFSAYTEMAIGISADLRLSATGKFPPSLSGDRHPRFLAALAHFAVEFFARLSLHSAWWQLARTKALCACDYGHHGAMRLVARSGLDVRGMGIVAWPRPCHLSCLAATGAPTAEVSRMGPHYDVCACRLGSFSGCELYCRRIDFDVACW